MRVHLSTPLSAPPEWVAAQLQSSAVFRHITAPLIQFHPARGTEWPTHWAPGELALHMRLLGVLPMGPQTVRISIAPPALADDTAERPVCPGVLPAPPKALAPTGRAACRRGRRPHRATQVRRVQPPAGQLCPPA